MTIQAYEDNQGESWETTDQLQQRDEDIPALPVPPARVVVENLVRTRSLPARRMANGNLPLTNDGTAKRIVGSSDQRMAVAISTYGAGVYISTNPNSGTGGSYLPNGMTRSYTYTGEIYAVCATTETASTLVSFDALYVED